MTADDPSRAEVTQRNGGIALPGDPAFQDATQVFNLIATPRPVAAITARTVAEVRAALDYARAHKLAVRVYGTGHAAAAHRPVRDAVLIRTELAGPVEIDSERRVARIPAGTRWGAVVQAAAGHGLAVAHGSSPTVGVVGYLLGGGMSFYGRKVGVAANAVRAIELVTADGELHRVSAEADPELFWALRGGGGGFGVVTAIEISLFQAARVFTGSAFWPAAKAPELLRAWLRWTQDAPWEVTTSLRVVNLPPVPGVPPVLAAGPVLSVDGAVLSITEDDLASAQAQAQDLLGPLREIAEPLLDTWQLTVPADVLHAHMDPTDPVPFVGDHMLLRDLGTDGADRFLEAVGPGSGSPLVVSGLRQLGGAYAVADPAGGAFNHVDASYAYLGSAPPLGEVTVAEIRQHCSVVRAALSPWDTGRTAPTFVENFEQPQGHLRPDQIQAVDRMRARVDPRAVFRDDITPNATALR